ncbi:N-acetylmuramoyl-L-alanine amidase family protein [Bacillus sp. BGMRC 2118]|nr:N-acetylmuramoyl-L-alanine amidase family protein [Bacillus sp. BGMRC 2118]
MKAKLSFFSLAFVLLLAFLPQQVTQAASVYNATVTIGGEEYPLANTSNHFAWNLDQYVMQYGIEETDKVTKISVTTPEGVESVTFDFFDDVTDWAVGELNWDQQLTVVNNKAEYIVSDVLGEHDNGQDGVSVAILRELLRYGYENLAYAEVTATYTDGSTEDFSLSVEAGGWVKVDGKWYFFDDYGNKVTGWILYNNQWYLLDKTTGEMLTGWQKVDGKWYFLDLINGNMKHNTLVGGYILGTSGAMVTNAWVSADNHYYFADAKGQPTKNAWKKDGAYWYYLGADGKMFSSKWALSGKNWYYLGANGVMQTGWLHQGKQWYFLNQSGDMVTGWKLVGKKWYYFYNTGVMAHSTKIGNYQLDPNGVWVR